MGKTSTFPWVLEFQTSRAPGTLKLFIEDKAVVGRAEESLGVSPDLDLTPFNAAGLGVAVKHITIQVKNDALTIVDLGNSITILNGTTLEAHIPQPFNHGDKLQLGDLQLEVRIIASPTKGSVVHQQPDLQLDGETQQGAGQSVLIVEDDPLTADLLKLALQRAGFETRICHEVVSAIRSLSNDTHSAVVLDLMLPNIHGLELCRYVRRDIHQRDIPIIVVSAAVSASSIKQAIEAGADVFLGKPFNINELIKKVSALVYWYDAHKPSAQTKNLSETDTAKQLEVEPKSEALVVFVSGYQEPIAVVLSKRTVIGRRSGADTTKPHIDLDRYGAFESGVSRKHAVIHSSDDGFYIEDLGSSNGTWVNEVLLPPHEPRLLENASEIRVGHMRLRVFFFTEEDQQALMGGRKQTSEEKPKPDGEKSRSEKLEQS